MKLNSKGVSHARSLISSSKVDRDSAWEFGAEDGNKILGKDNWDEYSKWFLATDPEADEKTKEHYKYPYGKEGKVYRAGVIAAKQRAAQQGESSIADAADGLLKLIDKDKKEEKTVTKFGMFYRQFAIEPGNIDKENRTAKLSFSSEAPVDRFYGKEVLDHSPSSVRMGRLQSGGPLLVNHNSDDQVGVIEKASLGTDRIGRAVVRFGKSARADEIFNDVQDGIRRHTSTGYRVYQMAEEGGRAKDEEPCYRATDWEPHEISIASIPADTSVGVGRATEEKNEIIMIRSISDPDSQGRNRKMGEEVKNERQRVLNINATAKSFTMISNINELAERAVEDGTSIEDFNRSVLDALGKPQPTPYYGSGAREVGRKGPFRSLGEQLVSIVEASRSGGHEDPRLGYVNRAISGMSVSVPSDGGFAVQTEFVTGLLDKFQTQAVLAPRCFQIPIGPDADGIEGPYIDETSRATGSRWGGVQVYRTAEAVQATNKQPKLGKFEIRLEDLKGLAYVTNRLLRDATGLEALLSRGFVEELAFVVDDEIIRGTGVGQCLGVLNSPALITVAKETGQTAATIQYENLVKIYSRMPARLRNTAAWFCNQEIEPQLFTMGLTLGTGGAPVFMPPGAASASPYSTLFGKPLIPIEQASALGTVGDIMFLCLDQYCLASKGGIEAAVSMHVRFIYDEMTFKWTYRVNGMPAPPWRTTLTPYKGSNALSPFVTLAAR